MDEQRILTGPDYRITVLTDRLIRLEFQKEGRFEDRTTRTVVNRDIAAFGADPVISAVNPENGALVVETEELKLEYDKKPFSSKGLSITLKETGEVWHYSIVYGNSDKNYLGTARTLDLTDGFAELDPGLFGLHGYAVLDDSKSAVCEDGEYFNLAYDRKDLYFFGYGKDFYAGLKAFYTLCGKTPMIPRYALGNWWSRYRRYTEESYTELLDNFEKEQIPLSVAVIDMDWHLTNVDPKYGTGWTGYTWDEECFPDYRRFLSELKRRKLAPTLNLHPADGIRAYEAMYEKAAKRLGMDPEKGEPIEFDMSDKKYREAYFEDALHPYEDEGVAFWWIDWQQGTGDEGAVDPLFLLNHYHYVDMEKRGKRPMIFSRYAGPGSHRYPVGFSGDTRSTWRSLAYQPFFTATASNIGYGWWSHDIGGHMLGDKDNERLIRWIQFGVFSPVMRLHSSNSLFFNKEPWTVTEPYHGVMAEFMRLRHRLIPYLYTESRFAHTDDVPLIQPLYYRYPDEKVAYETGNEYIFGRSLIVCAITAPEDKELQMASVDAFIPEGRWYDIFTGMIYEGKGRKRKLYRTIDSIPVLLKAGGIVPESVEDTTNGTDNPSSLRILYGAGESGEYTIYEDDGVSMDYCNGKYVTTRLSVNWNKDACEFAVDAAQGETALVPGTRDYELDLYGVCPEESFDAFGADFSYDKDRCVLKVKLRGVNTLTGAVLRLKGLKLTGNAKRDRLIELLNRAWTVNDYKERIFWAFEEAEDEERFIRRLSGLEVPETLKDAVREIFE